MSFPWHDPPWREVGDLLEVEVASGERVLAPDLFWWRLPELWRYVPANLTADADFDWVVVHKGELPAVPRPFLEHVVATMTPALANEVFVVFANDARHAPVDPRSPHLLPFVAALAQLPTVPVEEHPAVHDRVLGIERRVRKFAALTPAEARAAQDEFFAAGGYTYPTRRDQAYFAEVIHHRDEMLAEATGARIFELCCGAFPVGPLPPGAVLVRSDFSAAGVARAVAADGDRSGVVHVVCDAHAVAAADASCDVVLFVDSIEHVLDADTVLAEAGRVLRPGGQLLLTFSNRNSLNQVLTRALGYPEFVTNHQHVREFTLAELTAVLHRCGLDVVDTAGVELRPYWGVPGVDDLVRGAVDDDDELVDALRELGRRAGAEYAYVGVIRATRR
jgi:SAM-dependent methyltransferase